MFDFKFNWDASIETGIDIVDTQHKELFRIGRAVEQLVITKCIEYDEKHLLQIVCELREYVAYHFYDEEHLMETHHYSKLEEHKAEHKRFQELIMGIDLRLFDNNTLEEVVKLKDLITQMVFQHMLSMDQEMANELREKI